MMAIRAALTHKTRYRFDRPVQIFPHEVRLRPCAHARTPIESYALTITPKHHFINWQQDGFGNFLARLVFTEPARELVIEVALNANLTVINPFDFFILPEAELFPFAYSEAQRAELAPFFECNGAGPKLLALREAFGHGLSHNNGANRPRTIDFLVNVNHKLHSLIEYAIRLEPGVQSPEETLTLGKGSCRDSAWLMVQLMRQMGLAARFVSGYLIQLAADIKPLKGPAGPTRDFTDLHAWAEVYVPGAGWIGLDATSGLLTSEGHIPLAATAHHQSAAPIIGTTEPCKVDFSFEMDVARIIEDPRVTKPYSEEDWAAIDALGQKIDADLERLDVRLTHGGEPTFVSESDMDSAQWNTAALGAQKRAMAEDLLFRLKHRFAPGSALQFNLGKWYPGESLPRWALECFWRADGVPLWHDTRLIAMPPAPERAQPPTLAQAKAFMTTLTDFLRLPQERIMEAWEDPLPALKDEANLPPDIDFTTVDFADGDVRKRLVHLFENHGLTSVAGYVLPLRAVPRARKEAPTTWQTGAWPTRRPRLYLISGDSPLGLRLPISALPAGWRSSNDDFFVEDPFARAEPMLQRQGNETLSQSGDQEITGFGAAGFGASHPKSDDEHDPPLPKAYALDLHDGLDGASTLLVATALCVEVRDGMLHVFLPPLTNLEDWLRLVAAIELAAQSLNQPVRLEGYAPVPDPRLKRFAITPDPGVIEVNVQPAQSWSELKSIITGLYEEARHTHLSSEKFMLDGRHTGTGGGNHVTFGGLRAADSPFLRRPDLLRSLISYFQNHPGLSYAFCGQFVGPTSQSPRVDETREDSLHELAIAFAELDRLAAKDGTNLPWTADRLLRHLLMDLTGNTHRAEFSIDKLFSPDGPAGRLGLIEFRAFEMPPHPRMSLAQMVLLRALIAWFWQTPYRRPLVRWHTELHDRFMLPHFIRQDLADVAYDISEAGYGVRPEWFSPFIEFRFPRYGTAHVRGISLELRQAIEPWHVLGEEVTAQGTARYVDSSVERLQVKITGMHEARYSLQCNGRAVPLVATGTQGEFVAGVRFKAWNPPSSLHPTIEPHNPLVFDLVDGWNARAIGGCTYHVVHPGGRSFDTFPVNAAEAESRRFARFTPGGHTGGHVMAKPVVRDRDFPTTLDLRKTRR